MADISHSSLVPLDDAPLVDLLIGTAGFHDEGGGRALPVVQLPEPGRELGEGEAALEEGVTRDEQDVVVGADLAV